MKLFFHKSSSNEAKVSRDIIRDTPESTIRSGLRLGRSQVLRSLRCYLRAQSQGHHTIDRLEERGFRKRKRWTIFFDRREGVMPSDQHGNCSRCKAGYLRWQSLKFGIHSPQDLRDCSTLSSFKAKLKTFFSQYFRPN